MKKILSILLTVALLFSVVPMAFSASAADTIIEFSLGANGSASHADGSSKTTYTETVNGYTLTLTSCTNLYTGARDAKGNGCVKFGATSKAGSCTFTVPSDVTSVVLYFAKYKSNTSKVTINGTTTTLTKNSNDGAYDEITIDTTSTKTISITTVSGGYRAMLNTIKFVIPADESDCEHAYAETDRAEAGCETDGTITETCSKCGEEKTSTIPATGHDYEETDITDSTCTVAGVLTETCANCGDEKTTELPLAAHTFENGKCTVCGAEQPNEVTFELGANGTASHNEGSEKTTYTETVGDYTLNITGGTKMYTGARDAKGNGALKIGTSKVTGGFTFDVDANVEKVIIAIAKYKANATTVAVNGVNYTLTKSSNDGEYELIEVDTTTTKTITVATVGTTYRAMVNSITYKFAEATGDADCKHENMTSETTDATCTATGLITYTCECGHVEYEVLEKIEHNMVDGMCTACGYVPNGPRDVILGVGTVDGFTTDFSVADIIKVNGAAGVQYADEMWKLTETLSMHIVKSHINADGTLRIYASSDNNGIVEFISTDAIATIVIKAKAQENASAITVYGKATEDGEYVELSSFDVATSVATYTFNIDAEDYKYIQLDVTGKAQVQVTDFAITTVNPEAATCEHANTTFETTADSHTEICSDCGSRFDTVAHDFANGDCVCGMKAYEVIEKDFNLTFDLDGVIYYFDGTSTGTIGGTTTDAAAAAIIKIATNGTYYVIYIDGETKQYLTVGSGSQSFSLSDAPCYFTVNEDGYYIAASGRTFALYTTETSATVRTYLPGGDFKYMNFTEVVTEVPHEHVAGDWEVVTEATNASNGLMVKKCACGEVMEEKVIPAILKFKGASLELQSNLSIIYTVDKTFFTTFGYTKPYVVFQLGAVTEVVTEYTLRSSDGAYQFKFSGIAPQFMNDNIVATLYAENNGETYTAVHNTYSVVTYCKSQLGKTTSSATFKTFLVDTLKYGSAAQVYAKHNTTKLAIDELTADQKALGTTAEIAVTDYLNLNSTVIENATSNFKSASLFLEDSITVRYSFELINGQTIDGVKFFVNVPSIGKSWTLTEEDFTYDAARKRYYVDFSELNPSQMRDIIHTTVMKDGAAISNTIAYSIESYVARDKGGDANLTAMLKAMMQFGVAAEKYAGK